jgi:predicted nucleotidyltransferase
VSSSSDNSPGNQPIQQRLIEVLSSVAGLLESRHLNYALIGGLSVAFRGNVRNTEDIDLLIHVPAMELPGLLDAMEGIGCQIDQVAAIRQWNSDGILVVRWPGGVQVDLLKPVVPVLHHVLGRARTEAFGGQPLKVVDAEGLLLLKLIAFRPMDQEDIRGVLLANANQLDLDWIRTEARLAGIGDERLDAFESLVREFYVS